ncbi:probable serine/threonine-protein kinase yakA [Drosophila subpulchrella]|uniref:probable serine/threonine-protein kinase yakA n=1 Tax=Drosophila subpulchrella TaxID=1486046 RepID=UPI0018A17134|nr:probable serine/threonine-protein kinase yakA [Drosophila subpulchrella]
MAFVARRSSDGSVVDRHQVSGRSTLRPLSLSDISDEDSESVLGYTNSTYGAPTVRYVGQGENDIDTESEMEPESKGLAEDHNEDADLHFEDSLEDPADISGSETDSILSFCHQLEEEEANDAMRSGMMDYTDEDTVDYPDDDVDAEDVEDEDQKSMGKGDDATVTDTETVMNFDQDLISLSSFDSCTPTVTQRSEDLDNLSAKTFFKQDVMEDNISSKTFFKQDQLDGLSGKTSYKSAIKDKRQRSPVDLETDQLSSRTYNLSTGGSTRVSNRGSNRASNRLHDGSSLSTCSWSEMYGGALQPADGRSNIVPSLSLASATSDTSTYFKSLEENKERQGQAAFEDWKARKAAQKQKTLMAAKKEQQKREAEAALRQKLSQERFQEWCRRKEEQQQKQLKQQQQQMQILRKKTTTSSQSSSGNSSASSLISGCGSGSSSGVGSSAGPVKKVPPEITNKRIKEWERIKAEQQQIERERQKKLQDNKQKLEAERRQRSQGAWKNWMKQVDKRAKPVPLNQGFDTLRGTISNIYINPVQWVSNIDPQDSGRSR